MKRPKIVVDRKGDLPLLSRAIMICTDQWGAETPILVVAGRRFIFAWRRNLETQ